MTIQRAIEEIKQVFPNVLESQVIYDLDRMQKDFVDETDYLESYVVLSDIHTYCAWTLPTGYRRFKEILLYDANNNPLELADYQITYEIEFGKIFFKSTTTTPITKLPAAIIYVYLGYYYTSDTLSATTDSFSINDSHIEGVTSKVYENYYSKFVVDILMPNGNIIKTRDFNAVNYYRGKVREYVIKAKKWVLGKNDTTDGSAINYGMAGEFVFSKRINSLAGTTLLPLSSEYSKYAIFTITDTPTITEDMTPIGYTTLAESISTRFVTLTSTGEFSNTTWINCNNKGFNIDSFTSSEIVISLPAGFGTVSLEVYER